jgi:hypothetical protein
LRRVPELTKLRPAHVTTLRSELSIGNLREGGMKLAVVGAGGDEGHAPARRSYEKAGYTALPLVRFYEAL